MGSKYDRIKVGDLVTCKTSVEGYYSGYGGNPVTHFEPGMEGTVASVKVPRVSRRFRRVGDKKKYLDDGPYFIVVDYQDEAGRQRCALDYSNCVKIRKMEVSNA